MHKKMLVPLDGSRMSELVAEYAKELALRLDLDLILLHICGPDDYELAPLHRAYINQTVESVAMICTKFMSGAVIKPPIKKQKHELSW